MAKLTFETLILFEDEDYIVINKPPFVATLDERTADRVQSILGLARAYHDTVQMAHRLDKETSGCLAIAKHNEAYKHLTLQFQNREVAKLYHAVIHDLRNFQQVEMDLPILKLSKKGMVTIDMQEGKPSLTIFNTLKLFREHTLVACQPVTGRMHQIRIHLACMDAPIVGDEMYGGAPFYLSDLKRNYHLKKGTEEQPLMKRFALHAHQLTFTSLAGEEVNVEAPYPKDFAALLKQLARFT
ncbi:MAG: RluA family pseudouridine synthase [Thermonemataceae bacterium]